MKRTIFFISDSTGITAETLGHALLTRFDNLEYGQVTVPFVRDGERAAEVVQEINAAAEADAHRPIVFSTLVNAEVHDVIEGANALVLDLFSVFLRPLELELNRGSSLTSGRFHGLVDRASYEVRIEAVDFALKHDDGGTTLGYEDADLILIGVSRSGKTPACVYLSMQFGVRAANYPLTEEVLDRSILPEGLLAHRSRLFGLTIHPERLRQIRQERRPNSQYSSLPRCRREVAEVEGLFKREGIPFLDTTAISVEEIATSILQKTGIRRRLL